MYASRATNGGGVRGENTEYPTANSSRVPPSAFFSPFPFSSPSPIDQRPNPKRSHSSNAHPTNAVTSSADANVSLHPTKMSGSAPRVPVAGAMEASRRYMGVSTGASHAQRSVSASMLNTVVDEYTKGGNRPSHHTQPPPTSLRALSPRIAGGGETAAAFLVPASAPTGDRIVARDAHKRSTLSIPRGVTSTHQQQQQQNENFKYSEYHDSNQSSRRVYTVCNMPTAGSIFVAITKTLLSRGDWVQIEPLGLKEVKAGPMPGAQGSINPCCSKLRGVNLFLGEKTLAEKLMAEARIVGLRGRRSSASASTTSARGGGAVGVLSCAHLRRTTLPENMAADAGDNLVCYLEGSRCITMKSRMVKTLVSYYRRLPQLRPMRYLHEYLPVTFILTPLSPTRRMTSAAYVDERDAMIDAMKTINDEDSSGNISTWIAKCSNGCHGDGIKIIKATTGGLKELLAYIDGFKDGVPWVVCRYIDRPLLYNKRKFDLRVWVLLMEDGRIYMHRDLVMRLSSVPYNPSLITTNTKEGLLANITNHCIQTTSDTYGLDEAGNELWWDSLQKLLLETAPPQPNSKPYGGRSPTSSPSKASAAARDCGGGLAQPAMPAADEAALLQMQRIITESFAATKEVIACDKGFLGMGVGGDSKGPSSAGASSGVAVTASANAAAYAVGGTIVSGMPALANGVIPYPTFFNGVPSSTTSGLSQRKGVSSTAAAPPSPEAFKKLGCDGFHIFGFDFLIDDRHKVWLLEINGSPGVADHLMKGIVDDTIELAVDTRFPRLNPASHLPTSRSRSTSPQRQGGRVPPRERTNGYELIYGPGVNKAMEYYRLSGASGKGYE